MRRNLDIDKPLTIKIRGGKTRTIPPGRWWINRNTPVGEDAEIYERKPYGGMKLIDYDKIVANGADWKGWPR